MENVDFNNISFEERDYTSFEQSKYTTLEQAENIYSTISNDIEKSNELKQIKETLESFHDYLGIVIKSVNQNKYNKSMVKDLCEIITKYYEDLYSDVESDSSSESSASSNNSHNYASLAKQLAKVNESGAETSDSDNDSTIANFLDDREEEKRPPKLVSITNEKEVDSDEDTPPINLRNIFRPHTPPAKKVDTYFQDFVNSKCDLTKRVTKFDYNVSERLSNYSKKVYSY